VTTQRAIGAGPFRTPDQQADGLAGIFVQDVTSPVIAGRFTVVIHPWLNTQRWLAAHRPD
jgi:hypothetical protein